MNAFSCWVLRELVRQTERQYSNAVPHSPVSGLQQMRQIACGKGKSVDRARNNIGSAFPRQLAEAAPAKQLCTCVIRQSAQLHTPMHSLVQAPEHLLQALLRCKPGRHAARHAVRIAAAAEVLVIASVAGAK